MKRIEALIEKLKAQQAAGAALPQLLATVQMLEKEITGSLKETEVLGASGIAVFVPHVPFIPSVVSNPEAELEKEIFQLDQPETDAAEEEEGPAHNLDIPLIEELMPSRPQIKSKPVPSPKKESPQTKIVFEAEDSFDALSEVPTLSQQIRPGQSVVKEQPTDDKPKPDLSIKDLKKDIQPHQRLLFISDLFRGDEDMYERSIKTISNFHAYAEAEYWIKRELKTKLGWPASDPTVDFFDLLVRKRFR